MTALIIGLGQALAQGIDATKHDLTGGGVSEICVFCHTPHGANAGIEAPLWNKPVASPAAYQTYDSPTMDGAVLDVGSVSAACLSCHDGTQSTDVVINAPGTGLTDPSGIALRGGDRFLNDPTKPSFIGTDLTDDHPVGVQYAGFGSPPIDPDFKTFGNGLQVATIDGVSRWWVDTETAPNGKRDKSDMILYTRNNVLGGGQPEPFVECASCHDPHTDANAMFLRLANADSDVCVACHVK